MNDITIVDALLSLKPGCQWTIRDNDYDKLIWHEPPEEDGGIPKPTREELDAEVERLEALYEYNQYQRDRAEAYPSIEDQLDLLYHGGYDVWKEEINKVKQKYPKPE
jgi:hypothetical protein